MDSQPTLSDLLLLPVLLLIFGLTTYGLTWSSARQKGTRMGIGRWVGIVLVFLAFLTGLRPTWDMLNPSTGKIYQASLFAANRRIVYSHYVSSLLPLACFIGIFVFEAMAKRQSRSDADY